MTEPRPAASAPACANCGAALAGPFCARCGQEDRDPTRIPAGRIFREWLGDVFTFDSRILRTLWPLVRRPGFLTEEYLAGRRVRYVPPLRLFVFLSLVMFLTMSLTGGELSWEVTSGGQRVAASGRHAERAAATEGEEDEAGPPASDDLDRGAAGPAADASAPGRLTDAAEINRRLVDRAPQVMLLLVPVLAFFLWLLHRRRVPYYMAHLIFSLHLHSFWFLAVTAALLVDLPFERLEPGKIVVLTTLVPYLFFAQRRVYGGGWMVNLWRTAVVSLAQLLSFLAAMLVLLMLTVLAG